MMSSTPRTTALTPLVPCGGWLQRGLEILVRTSIRRRGMVLSLLAAMALLALGGSVYLRVDWDASRLLADPSPPPEIPRTFMAETVILAFVPAGGVFSAEGLEDLRALTEAMMEVPGLERTATQSIATLRLPHLSGGQLDLRRLLDCYAADGTGGLQVLAEECRRLGLDRSPLLSPDYRSTAIIGYLLPGADRARVVDALRRIADSGHWRGKVFLAGSAAAKVELGRQSFQEIRWIFGLVCAVAWILLAIAIGSPLLATFVLIDVGLSLLLSTAILAACGVTFSITAVIVPVLVMILGASDDIYALNRALPGIAGQAGAGAEQLVREIAIAGTSVIPASFASGTVFALLLAAEVVPLRTLGLLGLLGIGFSCIFTFTLLPALVSWAGPQVGEKFEAGAAARLARRMAPMRPVKDRKQARHVGLVVLVAAGALAIAVARITVNDSWTHGLTRDSAAYRDNEWFDAHYLGGTAVDLVIDSGRPGGLVDPTGIATLARLQHEFAAISGVGATAGPLTLLGPALAFARPSLGSQLDQLTAASLSLEDIRAARMLLALDGRGEQGRWMDGPARRAHLTLLLRKADFVAVREVLRQAGEAYARFRPEGFANALILVGDVGATYRCIAALTGEMIRTIALSFLIVGVLLAWWFRSALDAAICLLPPLLTITAVTAFAAFASVPIGIANSLFIGIAFGTGADYAIHLRQAWKTGGDNGVELVRRAIVIALVSLVPAVLVVPVVSALPPTQELGWTVAASLLINYGCVLWLLPRFLKTAS